jgi:hypothetical protein
MIVSFREWEGTVVAASFIHFSFLFRRSLVDFQHCNCYHFHRIRRDPASATPFEKEHQYARRRRTFGSQVVPHFVLVKSKISISLALYKTRLKASEGPSEDSRTQDIGPMCFMQYMDALRSLTVA